VTRYLLDSHALIWWAEDPSLLSVEARYALAEGRHLVFVSVATIWEIGIKQASGKLKPPEDVRMLLSANRFDVLPISAAHAHHAPALPMHHNDPFDRMLVAQAVVEGLTLITRDKDIAKYEVSLLAA
jgi:PIN domain nuclease of toxin-antitoxin system